VIKSNGKTVRKKYSRSDCSPFFSLQKLHKNR